MLTLFITVVLSAEPEQIAAYLERCESARVAEIARTQEAIRKIGRPRTPQGRKRQDDLKARLAELKSGGLPSVEFRYPFSVGQLGTLGGCKIRQVVDSQNMLVADNIVVGTRKKLVGGVNGVVFEEPIVKLIWFWVEAPTDGLTDDAPHELQGVWEVAGTKQYDTVVGGTQTVFVLKQVDESLLKPQPGVSPRPKSSQRDPAGSTGSQPL